MLFRLTQSPPDIANFYLSRSLYYVHEFLTLVSVWTWDKLFHLLKNYPDESGSTEIFLHRELMKEEKEDGSAVARENYSSRSAAAVLMMVFQFAKDNTAIHRQGRKEAAREMSTFPPNFVK